MESVNANRTTASKLVRRSLQIADIENTDFLSYEELTEYLNSTWKNVYQNIIQYNLNIFTVDANLVGAAGRYKLPFDCYQIKSVKNPYTGRQIPRKADSESALGGYYEIVNDEIVLGPNVGPVVITYWRKPFWLSVPDKKIDTQLDLEWTILDSCKNSVLVKDSESKLYVYNLLTMNKLELPMNYLNEHTYYLGNNFIVDYYSDNIYLYDFLGNELTSTSSISVDYFIKSDDGLIYIGLIDDNSINIYFIGDTNVITTIPYDENIEDIVCIEEQFYVCETGSFPIGIFDNRPAYITPNRELHLINPEGNEIVEKVSISSIGPVILVKYGFLTFDGTLYSCVPDTLLDFPNNLYYDVISYDLAIRFLCKQNADSTGVENLNKNAWLQLTSGIDQSADYPRVKLVRR